MSLCSRFRTRWDKTPTLLNSLNFHTRALHAYNMLDPAAKQKYVMSPTTRLFICNASGTSNVVGKFWTGLAEQVAPLVHRTSNCFGFLPFQIYTKYKNVHTNNYAIWNNLVRYELVVTKYILAWYWISTLQFCQNSLYILILQTYVKLSFQLSTELVSCKTFVQFWNQHMRINLDSEVSFMVPT